MMKRIIAAAAASVFLLCFAGGCRNDDDPVYPDDTPAVTQAAAPRSEDASDASGSGQTPVVRPDDAWSTTIPRTTTTVPETTEPDDVPDNETKPTSDTTAAPTTQSPDGQTQTTRASLVEQWRALRRRPKNLKPDPKFFNDVVFVGDSVTLGLRNYATAQRNDGKDCLGDAQFLCSGSMSYTNALEKVDGKSMHPTYKGKKVTVEDGVKQCGAKKVFIMLGMNDFSAYEEEVWQQSVGQLVDQILEKTPGAAIVIQSVTPILSGKEHGRFTNAKIRQFNEYLQKFCRERGYTYLDISSVLADDSGHLKKEFCGDPGAMGIHMSYEGCAAWVDYLQTTFCGTAD